MDELEIIELLESSEIKCDQCGTTFKRENALEKHKRRER